MSRNKYIRLLTQAVITAGGTVERKDTHGLKVVGPTGIAFCGTKDQRRANTVSYVRVRTGLRISF